MKYIKKLNINFDDWDNYITDNNFKFLIFKMFDSSIYIGYIIKTYFGYSIKLFNGHYYGIYSLHNINNDLSSDDKIYLNNENKDFVKFSEIDLNKVLIVGKDYDKRYIINNVINFVKVDDYPKYGVGYYDYDISEILK